MAASEDGLPPVFGTVDLHRHGVTRSTARHRLSTRRWVRLSPGIYAAAKEWGALPLSDRLALTGLAQQRNVHPDKVISHVSAAALHGLALPLAPGRATWMTVDQGGNRPRRSASLVIQRASLGRSDTVRAGSAAPSLQAEGRLTSLPRTVADCARHLSLPDAVAMADSAARLAPGANAAFGDVLRRQHGWPGVAAARVAYGLVDARRETWLESYSLVALHLAGLPVPEPQVRLFDPQGRFVARVDALWHQWGVVGEADGLAKYTAEGADGASAVRAVLAEKVREDRIRDLGLEVVRWSVGDVTRRVGDVAARVTAAARRGSPQRFAGRWLPTTAPGEGPAGPLRPTLRTSWS